LAIAEFGPRSLVYHEGRSYRVYKAKLPPDARDADGRLVTRTLHVCKTCGATHDEGRERCHACSSPMADAQTIDHVLRIDNVETTIQERITANDEDRQRQGFDLQTVFAWPVRDGGPDVMRAKAADAAGLVCYIDYATGALISRVNKGLRRRALKSRLGFMINPTNGVWARLDDDTEEDDRRPGQVAPQPVVPIVQDHKNAALLRIGGDMLPLKSVATLQHALIRGIELCFQVEEGEILIEPTPSREERRALLAYEASEGGAGVLGRLALDPDMLAQVATRALELMHYEDPSAAITATKPALLTDKPGADCVKGCYRCLLSYYNQPDHLLIDRTDDTALRVLLRLARSTVALQSTGASVGRFSCNAPGANPWLDALTGWGVPHPDGEPVVLGAKTLPFAWRNHLVAAGPEADVVDVRPVAEAQGYTVIGLPTEPDGTPPEGLLEAFGITR
jgi:hypothetical protein